MGDIWVPSPSFTLPIAIWANTCVANDNRSSHHRANQSLTRSLEMSKKLFREFVGNIPDSKLQDISPENCHRTLYTEPQPSENYRLDKQGVRLLYPSYFSTIVVGAGPKLALTLASTDNKGRLL